VRDVHRLKKMTQEKYPGVPYIILGHSFGSFVTREYLSRYGTGIQAAIIMGTGWTPGAAIGFLKTLCFIQKIFLGDKHHSNFVNSVGFGSYLKKIDNPRTDFDWLSHNEESIDAYIANPADNFVFTVNGFRTMAELLSRVQNTDKMERIPKDLPILLIAGKEDPVGSYGQAVEKLYNIYKNDLNIKSVDLKLYDDLRHEILNETDRQKVYEDCLGWILEKSGN
ncbi:MAG: alpha/beta hydrolase, partial [Butyrivibrio sp.]|nr:alpha/beta hydrolase [Butyrivibrio sp.]